MGGIKRDAALMMPDGKRSAAWGRVHGIVQDGVHGGVYGRAYGGVYGGVLYCTWSTTRFEFTVEYLWWTTR